jgi:hypothetical protein
MSGMNGPGSIGRSPCSGWVRAASRWRNNMTILKSVVGVTVLLAGGSSLATAQNGPATGGEHPVAGGAAGGGRPACLRWCSLDSMRGLALHHDALIRRGVACG